MNKRSKKVKIFPSRLLKRGDYRLRYRCEGKETPNGRKIEGRNEQKNAYIIGYEGVKNNTRQS